GTAGGAAGPLGRPCLPQRRGRPGGDRSHRLRRSRRARVARGRAASARASGHRRMARRADSRRRRRRDPTPVRDGWGGAVRRRRRRDCAGRGARGAARRARSEGGSARARRGEGAAGRLLLRQRRFAGAARRLRRRSPGGATSVSLRRWLVVAAVGLAALAAFLYLQRTQPAWYERLWYPLRYSAIVRGHASNYHLDPALLAAVIEAESKFNADAQSRAGAVGLMQLTPSTAKGIALYTG